jgi:hypothetical protein
VDRGDIHIEGILLDRGGCQIVGSQGGDQRMCLLDRGAAEALADGQGGFQIRELWPGREHQNRTAADQRDVGETRRWVFIE